MLQDKKINQKDYERASQLLGRLFEVDSDITVQINRCIECYGVQEIFKNIETFDFTQDVLEKLNAVRLVLFGLGEEVISEELIEELCKQQSGIPEGGGVQ